MRNRSGFPFESSNRRRTLFGRECPSTFTGQTCSVASLLTYLVARGTQGGPLFQLEDGSQLTRTQLVTEVRKALRGAQIDPEKYAGIPSALGRPPRRRHAGSQSKSSNTGKPSIPTLREDPKYRARRNLSPWQGRTYSSVMWQLYVGAWNSSCVVIYQWCMSGRIVYEAIIVEEGLGGRLRLGGVWQLNSHALPPPPPPPPQMKGVWCSGCHSHRINQGGIP